MTTPNDSDRPQPGSSASSDELQDDIERTRQRLGQTVDALSERLDLKKQTEHKLHDAKTSAAAQFETLRGHARSVVAQTKDAATDQAGTVKPAVAIGMAITAGLAVILVLVARNRR